MRHLVLALAASIQSLLVFPAQADDCTTAVTAAFKKLRKAPSFRMETNTTDFTPGFDEIDLSGIDANSGLSGNQAFTFRGTGNFAGAGSLVYRKFDNAGTANDRTIIFADANGDGRSDFQIELTGLKTLSVGDFVL